MAKYFGFLKYFMVKITIFCCILSFVAIYANCTNLISRIMILFADRNLCLMNFVIYLFRNNQYSGKYKLKKIVVLGSF